MAHTEVFDSHFLFTEWRSVLGPPSVDVETQAVMVLSGAPFSKGGPRNYRELNIAKAEFGVRVLTQVVAHRLGISVDAVAVADFIHVGIPLILNGENEEVPFMVDAVATQIPREMIMPMGCSDLSETRTPDTRHNFRAINIFYPELSRISVITGSAQVPRALRTGLSELANRKTLLHMIGYCDPGVRLSVREHIGEVERVRRYVGQDDLVGKLTPKELRRVVSAGLRPMV